MREHLRELGGKASGEVVTVGGPRRHLVTSNFFAAFAGAFALGIRAGAVALAISPD